jgi:hypothetical protein
MVTHHQYLAQYPVDPASATLIVGTIHPHDHANFKVDFFYGSECSLWSILHEAFPSELSNPYCLDDIKGFLRRRRISMSDMILECRRLTPSALDKDLIPLRLNEELPDQIRRSSIREVLFTSGFGKNAAFSLFYRKVLKRPITALIQKNREVTLEPGLFGRPVRLRILYSPSGNAIRGVIRSKRYKMDSHMFERLPAPVKVFRVEDYRRIFGPIETNEED